MDYKKLIQILENTDGFEEVSPILDCIKRFRTENEFRVEANGITIFFDGKTHIEISENSIGFRTEKDYHQTTYACFYYEDLQDELEIEHKRNYHYIPKL